jgi:aminopeptidase N
VLAAAAGAAVPSPDPAPGISLALAEHRAHSISDVRYDLDLSIPENRTEPIRGTVTIRLRLRDPADPLILDFRHDFRQPRERILAVRVGGRPAPYDAVNGHIVLPPDALRAGENRIEIEFLAGDESLNRNDDFPTPSSSPTAPPSPSPASTSRTSRRGGA